MSKDIKDEDSALDFNHGQTGSWLMDFFTQDI